MPAKSRIKTAAEETAPRRSSVAENAPRRRPKQLKFAGVAPAVHEDIESAADDYVNIRDRRMEATEKETSAHASLLALMKRHKLASYRFDGMLVTLDTAERVRVKAVEANGEADE